jgi:hypothetical protein
MSGEMDTILTKLPFYSQVFIILHHAFNKQPLLFYRGTGIV